MSAHLLRRSVQSLLLGFNFAVSALTVPVIILARSVPVTTRIEALAGLAVLLTWLVVGHLRRRFPVALDAVALVALFAIAHAVPYPELALALFYASIWVRGFSRSWRNALFGGCIYWTAYYVAARLAGSPWFSAELAVNLVGLIGSAGVAKVLSDTLSVGDRTLELQRQLSEVGSRLLGLRDSEEVLETVCLAALRMVPEGQPAEIVAEVAATRLSARRSESGEIFLDRNTESSPFSAHRPAIEETIFVNRMAAGRFGVVVDRRVARQLARPIALLVAELGLALESVMLADTLRRESAAKSQFLATMSHELRTPLNSVLGFAQLLARQDYGALTDRQARYVEHIANSGQDLLAMINNLLDLGRISNGQLELSIEDFAVSEVLATAVEKVGRVAAEKGLHIDVVAGSGRAAVHADRRRTEQVILILLSNAIKFTPAGGTIRLSSRRTANGVEMSVTDTGVGIAEDKLSAIFQEFVQVDAGKSRSQQGSGLGLPLAGRLLGAMNGDIVVKSTPGKGSTFSCTLPAARTVSRRSPQPRRAASEDHPTPPPPSQASVPVMGT